MFLEFLPPPSADFITKNPLILCFNSKNTPQSNLDWGFLSHHRLHFTKVCECAIIEIMPKKQFKAENFSA